MLAVVTAVCMRRARSDRQRWIVLGVAYVLASCVAAWAVQAMSEVTAQIIASLHEPGPNR
ncbi:MAG: hypothetical protein H6825_05575 [Planctomycetes bacterium]|nr:hypothetical protein [Planctomycetota bacterium]